MNRSLRRIAFPAGIAVALASAAACKSDVTTAEDDVLANDSTLALQVYQTNGETPSTAGIGDSLPPLESDVAAQPRQAVSTAVPTAKARAETAVHTVSSTSSSTRRARPANIVSSETGRAWLVIPAGSVIELESEQRICSNTAMPGDLFTATVSEPVIRANGTIIPEGSSARAEVVSLGASDQARVGVRIRSLLVNGRTYPVSSRVTSSESKRVRVKSGSGSATRVAAGTLAGAVLGQVIGRNVKSTVIGAAGGAATGAVLASRSGSIAQCLPDGGRITAELTAPLRIALSE